MKKYIKYLIALAAGIAAAAGISLARDVLNQPLMSELLRIWCDSFFVAGVVEICIGLVIFSANEGTFDILIYGISSFLGMFKKNYVRKYDTFYDYRAEKADKKIKWLYLVICGSVFVAVSLVMLYFYKA